MKRITITKVFAGALLILVAAAGVAPAVEFGASWSNVPDRVWVGPDFWANRLQDWRVAGGRLECVESKAGKPLRTVHLLTHTLGEGGGEFSISARLGLIDKAPLSSAGFLIGAGQGIDYRAAALIHHSRGENAGLFAGIDGKGSLYIDDLSVAPAKLKQAAQKILARSESGRGRAARDRAAPRRPTYRRSIRSHAHGPRSEDPRGAQPPRSRRH